MLYSFECRFCGMQFDDVQKLADFHEPACPNCGRESRQIIALGHGGIQRDEPTWLPSARQVLQDESEKPIGNRCEYKRYLKRRGIVERG